MDNIVNNDAVSWSPYHSSRNPGPNVCISVLSLRPLLQESPHSVAVIHSLMDPIGTQSRALPFFHPFTVCDTVSAFVDAWLITE